MELLLVASVFVVSIAALQRATGAGRRNLILVVLLVGSLAAVPHFLRKPAAGTDGDPGTQQVPAQVKDFGYVSSKACRTCHPSEYASWHQSYHRTMTQVVTPDTVVSDWQGTLTWRDKAYHLERDGDEYWVDMVDPGWRAADATKRRLLATSDSNKRVRKRVLMSTGSHHQQVYWLSSGQGREMEQFAFTWLIDEERWIPYEESFLRPKRKDEESTLWNTRCIKCHATLGQPGLDEAGIPDTKVAELGIACEACHGPGGEHVLANSNPARRYALHLSGQDDPTIINPGKLSAERSSEICGQCHSVLAMTSDRYAKWRKVEGEEVVGARVVREPPVPLEGEMEVAIRPAALRSTGVIHGARGTEQLVVDGEEAALAGIGLIDGAIENVASVRLQLDDDRQPHRHVDAQHVVVPLVEGQLAVDHDVRPSRRRLTSRPRAVHAPTHDRQPGLRAGPGRPPVRRRWHRLAVNLTQPRRRFGRDAWIALQGQ